MRQINWGIIGCGDVTERKSGPAFGKVGGSHVVAVMRRNSAKAKDYALRHGIPVWYDDASDLINDENVNAVYIATPPASHAGYAIQAMEKGKAVYVEKPMASQYADCLKMSDVSKSTGIPLYVAYYRRFLPYFIQVKEILDKGLLGGLLYARVDFRVSPRTEDHNRDLLPWRLMPEIAGAGYFYDLACHQLDLLEWYFGKPLDVAGRGFNRRGLYDPEDTVFAQITYDSGLPLSGQWCFAANEVDHMDSIGIFGTKGSLEFSTFDFTPIRHFSEEGIVEFLPENPENIQYWFIKNMVEELQEIRPAKANIDSAVLTNWTMDKILEKL